MMRLFKTEAAVCPRDLHCAEWARIHMEYCLCSVKDGVSFGLGLVSVISWGVAERPQLLTNYEKSTEGLSIAFLTTWIIGDLFNLFGCLLEPATLPTQYHMAMGLEPIKTGAAEKTRQSVNGVGKQVNSPGRSSISSNTIDKENVTTLIPLPAFPRNRSPERESYYMSARSLSRSHTPTVGSCLAQRMSPTSHHSRSFIEEPLLGEHVSPQPTPSPNTKTMPCLVSVMIFLGTFNLQHSNTEHNMGFEKSNKEFVVQVRRKLLQVSGGLVEENGMEGSSGIGSLLGWAMAAIYMGGRLPQICLNIKRGNVEGLNPLMFVFALAGNATYVASILVNSLDWSRVRPNLPWLVDAGGCVLLDSFILIQFIYF